MMGLTILIVVISFSFVALRGFSLGFTGMSMRSKADHKLQSVADELRRKAIGEFYTLDSPPQCPPLLCVDKKVSVTADIGPIDPFNHTRTVSLAASWKEGEENKTKNMTFTLSQLRGKAKGGRIQVKVVDGKTGSPVQDIDVFAMGQEISTVSCRTDNTGQCLLSEVLLAPSVTVTFNGNMARYYFPADPARPNDADTGSWVRSYTAGPVVSSDVVIMPVKMAFPPGTISGEVKDIADGTYAGGVKVFLLDKPGSTVIVPVGIHDPVVTDASGNFTFPNVVPGLYSVHVLGSRDVYAAVAQVNDYVDTTRRTYYPVATGEITTLLDENTDVTRKALKTVKKGALNVRVRGIKYTGVGPAAYDPIFTDPTQTVSLFLYTNSAFQYTIYKDSPLETFYLGWPYPSVPYMEIKPEVFYTSGYNSYYYPFFRIDVPDGNYQQSPNIGPWIVDSTYTLTNQYNLTAVSTDKSIPSPFTPVLVMPNPGLDTPAIFYMTTNNYNHEVLPYTFTPAGQSVSVPNLKTFGNGAITNQTVYLLHENSFGSVSGQILDEATLTPFDQPAGTNASVQVRAGYHDGYGTLDVQGGIASLRSDDKKTLDLRRCHIRPASTPYPVSLKVSTF